MAVLTAKKSGKASDAATWTPESAPTTTSELVVPTGLTVEIAANLSVVSAKTEGTGTFSGTKVLTLSGSGNSLNLGGANLALTGAGKIVLGPSGGTTTEPITNGADVKTITFSGATTSKFKLKEAITASIELVIKEGIFKSENFGLNLGKFIWEGTLTKEIILGTSVVKLSGTEPFSPGSTLPTLSIGSSVWECTSTECKIGPLEIAVQLPTVKFTGKSVFLRGATAIKITTLELALAGSGRSVEIENGTVVEVTTITKSAGVIVLKRNGASVVGQLSKASGTVTLEELEVENIKAEGGATFKVVNGKDLGGNSGWTFSIVHADSGAGTTKAGGTSTQRLTFTDSLAGTAKASGVRADIYTARDAINGTTKASGVPHDAYKAVDARSGTTTASGSAVSSAGFTDARSGTTKASGASSDAYKASDARSGTVTATGARSEQSIHSDARAGTTKASGSFTQAYRVVDARSGTTKANGTGTDSWSHAGTFIDTRNGTTHASGTRSDSYKAADVSRGSAKASGTGTHDLYKASDKRSGTTTATGSRVEALRFVDARSGTVHAIGESLDEHGRVDARNGTVTATGASVEMLRFTDAGNLTAHALGFGIDSYTTPLKPALVTIKLRHSARIAVTVRR